MNAVTKKTQDAAVAPTKSTGLVARIASKYGVDADKMLETMKATCFRQRGEKQVTNEQMMALLVVAEQYGLNPFTKEIYAFASDGGITPIIGVDGWLRLINERPEFESMELRYAEDGDDNPWIECTIHRKDRSLPISVREYMDECARDTGPWKSHPRRMLRHKAIIQCARVAFGFAGVYDPDEGERVANAIDVTPTHVGKPKTEAPRARIKQDPEPTDGVVRISTDQATVIADKLKEEGVELSHFLANLEIGSIEDLLIERYQKALNLIDELSAG
jgi:phage recombination protein Bet